MAWSRWTGSMPEERRLVEVSRAKVALQRAVVEHEKNVLGGLVHGLRVRERRLREMIAAGGELEE